MVNATGELDMARLVIRLTPKEHEVIWHRLGEGLIPEVLSDDPDKTEAECAARREELEATEDRMSEYRDLGFISLATQDEMDILADAFEGSTFWASFNNMTGAERGAERRVHDALRTKLEAVLGRPLESPLTD